MKRLGFLFGVLFLVVAWSWLLGDSQAQEKKELSIKQIMNKAHKGGDALLTKLGKELNSDDIPWKDVDSQAEELIKLGKALGANKPKKGDDASWKEHTTKYTANAKALEKAAHKMDKDAAKKSFASLKGSCKGCHDNHR